MWRLSFEIYIFCVTRWSTGQIICIVLVQSIIQNVFVSFTVIINLLCFTLFVWLVHSWYVCTPPPTRTSATRYIHMWLGALQFSLTLNTAPYSPWHSTCIKYITGKWLILFLFLLFCFAVTKEINCAKSTQPSNLQCQLVLSLISFHYYSISCMDKYEVPVVITWRSTPVSDSNATKCRQERLTLNNWLYCK
jgi:hypothetical protein